MIGRDPPANGILQRGVLYRFRVPRRPEREFAPELLEVVRRVQAAQIREYLRKKRAS